MFPFYSPKELERFKFAEIGKNIIIKRTVQFYNPKRVHLKNNIIIDDFCIISAQKDVFIGNNVHINSYCSLYGNYGIIMEDYTGLSSRVTLYTESDDYSGNSLTNPTIPIEFKPKYATGTIHIKKHAIIGTNTTIMPGISIGEGTAVGAHSFVTSNCEAWGIYFGVPAKKIKERSKKLLDLEKEYER